MLRSGAAGPTLGSSLVEERILGRTGRAVSVIGLGTWQLGADWGEVDEAGALAALDAAAQAGVTFLDTADVYGDGRSERLIGQFLAANPGLPMMVATKMGRRVPPDPAQYTLANFRAWTDRSRANLGTDTLHLVQLHCPPRRRPGWASSPASRSPRGCCPAGTPTTPPSPRTTIATTTATARRSTWGRPSPGWTSTPAWTPRANSRPWHRPGPPRPSSPWAGSSSSPASPR